MTYNEAIELVDYLNERFRKAGMTLWYRWTIPISWQKLLRWRDMLEEEANGTGADAEGS